MEGSRSLSKFNYKTAEFHTGEVISPECLEANSFAARCPAVSHLVVPLRGLNRFLHTLQVLI